MPNGYPCANCGKKTVAKHGDLCDRCKENLNWIMTDPEYMDRPVYVDKRTNRFPWERKPKGNK